MTKVCFSSCTLINNARRMQYSWCPSLAQAERLHFHSSFQLFPWSLIIDTTSFSTSRLLCYICRCSWYRTSNIVLMNPYFGRRAETLVMVSELLGWLTMFTLTWTLFMVISTPGACMMAPLLCYGPGTKEITNDGRLSPTVSFWTHKIQSQKHFPFIIFFIILKSRGLDFFKIRNLISLLCQTVHFSMLLSYLCHVQEFGMVLLPWRFYMLVVWFIKLSSVVR